jgi:predicted restriction endonuclease
MSIILLSELADHRARKASELKFYSDQKAVLETRLDLVRRELKLTDTILAMIRKETLVEVRV